MIDLRNVTLSYPDFPFRVEFKSAAYEQFVALHRPDINGPMERVEGGAVDWLMSKDRGPLLVTVISNDDTMPFERAWAYFEETTPILYAAQFDSASEFNFVELKGSSSLEAGAMRFNFARRDSAVQFKLLYGGR